MIEYVSGDVGKREGEREREGCCQSGGQREVTELIDVGEEVFT